MELQNDIIHVRDLTGPELALYTQPTETALLRHDEPLPGLFLAESPNVIARAAEAGYEPLSFLISEEQLRRHESENAGGVSPGISSLCAPFPKVPIFTAEEAVLKKITGFGMTRGVLSLMRRKPLPGVSDICAERRRIAVLENVVNPTNVGAIFRSAAALGVEAVLLTPDSADPFYRRAARVSMGTVFQIPWTYFPKTMNARERLALLHESGYATAAMALTDRSLALGDPAPAQEERLAVIMGTEGAGLCADTIAHSTYTIKIPMTNGVDSLNVAAASAVAFWNLCMQR